MPQKVFDIFVLFFSFVVSKISLDLVRMRLIAINQEIIWTFFVMSDEILLFAIFIVSMTWRIWGS